MLSYRQHLNEMTAKIERHPKIGVLVFGIGCFGGAIRILVGKNIDNDIISMLVVGIGVMVIGLSTMKKGR